VDDGGGADGICLTQVICCVVLVLVCPLCSFAENRSTHALCQYASLSYIQKLQSGGSRKKRQRKSDEIGKIESFFKSIEHVWSLPKELSDPLAFLRAKYHVMFNERYKKQKVRGEGVVRESDIVGRRDSGGAAEAGTRGGAGAGGRGAGGGGGAVR
jgi:hypothetical protein